MKTKEDNVDVSSLEIDILDKKENKKVIEIISKSIESKFKAHEMRNK